MSKNIVITGVSTGIGYGATSVFIRNGYQVFGSVRNLADAERLKAEFGNRFTPLIFDITDQKAIAGAVLTVKDHIGDEGLCGLINNAGAASGAPLMHMSLDSFRQHLEVLLIGQLAVTQQFLPLLGAQRNYPHKPGRIINITSVNGRIAAPFIGGYVASKHAMEGLSDTLRIELQIYGIDVIVVGPGVIKTAIWGKLPDEEAEKYKQTDFYQSSLTFNRFLKERAPIDGMELHDFSNQLFKIFELKKPKTRYTIARNKFKNWTIPRLLPQRVKDKYFAKLLGLNNIQPKQTY
jgi:NAD(P)-dependent dehydrogenase (short-subunit alcohol dehydrogenase family)